MERYNVLFICTGNSARSQIAEAIMNTIAADKFVAYSAGSRPRGMVEPLAEQLIRQFGYSKELRSKSWDEFRTADAPTMDFVITVCDDAAGEACPVWPGEPALAHWGVADPARTPDDASAFFKASQLLRRRIELLAALPLAQLDRLARQQAARNIAQETSV